jgi:hypothetical protein
LILHYLFYKYSTILVLNKLLVFFCRHCHVVGSFFGFFGIIAQAIAFPFECVIAKIRDVFFSPPPPTANDLSQNSAANDAEHDVSGHIIMAALVQTPEAKARIQTHASMKDLAPEQYQEMIRDYAARMPAHVYESLNHPETIEHLPAELRPFFMDLLKIKNELPSKFEPLLP